MPETVGIVARTDRKEAVVLASQLADRFKKEGYDIMLEPSLSKKMMRASAAVPLEKMKTDLVLTIGGDGTILRTCLHIPKPEPPILTIDMGVRGFLAEVPPEKALGAVERYLLGKYSIERFSKLSSFIGDIRLPDALNEVFVTSRYLAKLLHVRIWKDEFHVAECRADGVIVASQVGSTAYSFSSGGPILDPKLEAFVVTPVCPVTVLRPFVFPSDSTVKIELLKPKVATVVIDGDFQKEISEAESSVVVKKSEFESNFVRFEGDFYRRLKARLLFAREEGYEEN